jgi:archaellum biogenesis ATPase FlaH
MTFDQFLETLSGPKQRRGDSAAALCPCHDDKKPSLSVRLENSRILIHCHAGCKTEEICRVLGLRTADLFIESTRRATPPSSQRMMPKQSVGQEPVRFEADLEKLRRMQVALFENTEGLNFLKCRGVDLEIARQLRWGYVSNCRFDAKTTGPALAIPHIVNGRVVGVKFKKIDAPKQYLQIPGSRTDGLYGVDHIDFSCSEICIVEGPTDCGLLLSNKININVVAIHSASAKITPSDIELLSKFRRVFLLGDQDPAGQKAMDQIQAQLPPNKTVRPRLPGYKDVGELFDVRPVGFRTAITNILVLARATAENFEFDDLLTETEIKSMGSDVSRFLVEGLIPTNGITMLYAQEKSGKSMLAFYIGKCVANGVKVFGECAVTKAPAIYIDMENNTFDQQNFIDLFERVGPAKVRYLTRETGRPLLDGDALVEICRKHKPLLIIDSLTKFLGTADGFDPKDMSQIMDKLLNLCANGATIILIHHSIKKNKGQYALSYTVGADVSRSYNIISKNRPRLARVLMKADSCRGAEPQSVELEAFPAISELAMFRVVAGQTATKDDGTNLINKIVDFVASQPGRKCKRGDVMRAFRINRLHVVRCIDSAVEQVFLFEKPEGNAKMLSVPEVPPDRVTGTCSCD